MLRRAVKILLYEMGSMTSTLNPSPVSTPPLLRFLLVWRDIGLEIWRTTNSSPCQMVCWMVYHFYWTCEWTLRSRTFTKRSINNKADECSPESTGPTYSLDMHERICRVCVGFLALFSKGIDPHAGTQARERVVPLVLCRLGCHFKH